MSEKNRFGLSRDIPADIKRLIRQKCGYGCIFCGNWICDYEHIDPEWKDAIIHNPDNICLLCLNHHGRVTRRRISKIQVKYQLQNPMALQKGYVNDRLEMGEHFYIAMGFLLFKIPGDILVVDDDVLIRLFNNGKDLQLDARIYDDKQQLVLEIIQNEIKSYIGKWDIETKGNITTIRQRKNVILRFSLLPPNLIEIQNLNMRYKNSLIFINSKKQLVQSLDQNGASISLSRGSLNELNGPLFLNSKGIAFSPGVFSHHVELRDGNIDYKHYIDTGEIEAK